MVKKFIERLKFSKETLNSDMKDMPTLIYQFGVKMLTIEETVETLSLRLEITEAKIASSLRTKYRNIKNPPSETAIKDMVKANPEVIELKKELLSLSKMYKLAKLKSKSLGIKKDMIENYGHNIREERRAFHNKKI